MKNLTVINATQLRPEALEKLPDGRTAFDAVLGFTAKLPDCSKTIMLAQAPGLPGDARTPSGVELVVRESWNVESLLQILIEVSDGFDSVFYTFADTPLLDRGIFDRMYANHRKYISHYTFADGYPSGLTLEIVSRNGLEMMRPLASGNTASIARDTLFSVVQKDINEFDLETELPPKDYRLLRLSLSCDSRRNLLLLRRVMEAGGRDEMSVLDVLSTRPELLRTLPAYVPIQIIDGCPQACTYCPFSQTGSDILSKRNAMELSRFREIVEKVHEFTGDAVFSLSLWGEPSLHPRIEELVEAATSAEGLSVILETSGVAWRQESLDAIKATSEASITWIVSLDALAGELYRELRGEGYEEACATAEKLLALFPGRTHVQAVRMTENEEDLERFFRHWRQKTENVIIQKYDSFAGILPDRQVADLSPLKRFPCWHLKRDLHVLLDGSVPMCREDLSGGHVAGNILTDPLETIWHNVEQWYLAHVREEYPEICKRCDEYYTYNF